MKKIKFNEMDLPCNVPDTAFMSQWCCKCGTRHIWYFSVVRGKIPEEDEIYIDCFRDAKGEELRKFYERYKKE